MRRCASARFWTSAAFASSSACGTPVPLAVALARLLHSSCARTRVSPTALHRWQLKGIIIASRGNALQALAHDSVIVLREHDD